MERGRKRRRKRRELPSVVRKEVWLVAEEDNASFGMNMKPSTMGEEGEVGVVVPVADEGMEWQKCWATDSHVGGVVMVAKKAEGR